MSIEKEVIKILSEEIGLSPKEVKLNSNLQTDLGIDSFGSIEIFHALQERFKKRSIPRAALTNIKTVKDIVNYLKHNFKQEKNE